jgi:hypothetical protein
MVEAAQKREDSHAKQTHYMLPNYDFIGRSPLTDTLQPGSHQADEIPDRKTNIHELHSNSESTAA